MSKFKIRRRAKGEESFELNVTPMIDMFSVLISFLLITAVFSATGQMRVEVPFLSSKPPPTKQEVEKNKPEKVVTLIIDTDKVKLEVGLSDNSQTVKKDEYKTDDKGLDDLQGKLYALRQEDGKFDKVTVMSEMDVKYETLVAVLDAMRELKPGRQPIPWPADYKLPTGIDPSALIPKIIFGNVIL